MSKNLWSELKVVLRVEIWRLHYAETIRHWYTRFMENEAKIETLYDARFVRMFRFYLLASEYTFRNARQVVFQFQLSRKIDALPLTRNYMYPGDQTEERRHAAE